MNYQEWNSIIASFFFNETKDNTEVKLFITKEDIVDIGKSSGLDRTSDEIYKDYINSLKENLDKNKYWNKSSYPIIDVPLRFLKKWKANGREGSRYPPYIAYLVLYILPLTQLSSKTTWGYYTPLIRFLRKHGLLDPSQNISTPQFKKLDPIWYDLEEWSIDDKNTELGYFELHPFRNKNWKYVGKPLNQCIIPRKAINNLPELFDAKNIPPGLNLSRAYLRDLLIKNGANILELEEKTLKELKDGGELCDSIINIVKRKYDEWGGLTVLEDRDFENPKQGYTLASLKLCLSLDELNASANLYYRLYSKMEYPDDLYFNEDVDIIERGNGWSQKLHIPFQKSKALIDEKNKWKAIGKSKDLRLFVIGKYFNLEDWVETDGVVPSYDMLIMCTKARYSNVKKYIENLDGNNKELDINNGLPDGYHLFRLKEPQRLSGKISEIEYISEKEIMVEDGIKIGSRSYLKDPLPKIKVKNGLSSDRVFIQYRDSEKKIYLDRVEDELPIWMLPEDIDLDRKFHIKIAGQKTKKDKFYYRLESYRKLSNALIEKRLPKRNRFDKIVKKNNSSTSTYILGNSVKNYSSKRISRYRHFFKPSEQPKSNIHISYTNLGDNNEITDRLLYFLSSNEVINWRSYREEFDTIYRLNFTNEEIGIHRSKRKLRKWALYHFQRLGFVEYDFESRLIYPCPAKLLYIHTKVGRKCLLIGHRSPALITEIITEVSDLKLNIKFFEQEEKFEQYLLPQKILITGYSEDSNYHIDEKIKELSNRCSINFSDDYQTILLEFACELDEYIDNLRKLDATLFEDYPTTKFDAPELGYIAAKKSNIDKTLALVRYKINEYKSQNVLWIDGESYVVNPYWGRYYLLKKKSLDLIFYDENKNWLAIPSTVPLPMIFSKAFTLLSGTPPSLNNIQNSRFNIPFNIYENVPRTFAHNYLMKLGQKKLQAKIELS